MEGISASVPSDNQPIGGKHSAATIMGESKLLTDWIDPASIQVQNTYDKITSGLQSPEDKIKACLGYVSGIPYVQFVRVSTNVAGKTFVQPDAWLSPAEDIFAPRLNCANKTFLLTSLLRQELPSENVWACLGNLNSDHQGAHAFGYIRLDKDYILETTNPKVRDKFIPIEAVGNLYEDVLYVSDKEIRAIPEKRVREPFSGCYQCLPFLESYLAREFCRA